MKKGDAFALIAKPIARLSDFIFATNLEGCAACAERRRIMNEQTVWQIIKLLWCKLMSKIFNRP